MNLAFASLVLLIILLPGVQFILAYNIDPIFKARFKSDTTTIILWSIIPALVIQIICLSLVEILSAYEINFKYLGLLLLGTQQDEMTKIVFENIDKFKFHIFTYFLLTLSIARILGSLMLRIIWNFRLDLKIKALRFNNHWFYKFHNRTDTQVDFLFLRAEQSLDGVLIEYEGILTNYTFSKTDLELIYLKDVKQTLSWSFKEKEEKELKEVILKYSNLISLEISGYKLEVDEDGLINVKENNEHTPNNV